MTHRKTTALFFLFILALFCGCSSQRSGKNSGAKKDCVSCRELFTQDQQSWAEVLKPAQPAVTYPQGGGAGSEEGGVIPLSMFRTFKAHDGEINALTVTKDGKGVFSGGSDGKVLFHVIRGGRDSKILTAPILTGPKPVLALSLSPDERLLAVSQFSLISIYDLEKKRLARSLDRVQGRVTALTWDPRGELLALGRSDGEVFIWNVAGKAPAAGENSGEALEYYPGGSSAIVRFIFHPKGRILFAGERGGTIRVWRLLRTEREMGLRDENADVDKEREGDVRLKLGQLSSNLEDMWMSKDGSLLLALGSDGNLQRYQIRGLVTLPGQSFGARDLTGVTGLSVDGSPHSNDLMFVTAARDQKLKFWCLKYFTADRSGGSSGPRSLQIFKTTKQTDALSAPTDKESLESSLKREQAQSTVRKEDIEETRILPTPESSAVQAEAALVGETELFSSSVGKIGASNDGPVLWATQKGGILSWFDANLLLQAPQWRERVVRCRG